MSLRRFDLFTVLAFVPLASMLAMTRYVSRFDGWGAWGAAPLLLIPPILSLLVTGIGVLRVLAIRQDGRPGGIALALTAIAAVPLLWLLWRLALFA